MVEWMVVMWADRKAGLRDEWKVEKSADWRVALLVSP